MLHVRNTQSHVSLSRTEILIGKEMEHRMVVMTGLVLLTPMVIVDVSRYHITWYIVHLITSGLLKK